MTMFVVKADLGDVECRVSHVWCFAALCSADWTSSFLNQELQRWSSGHQHLSFSQTSASTPKPSTCKLANMKRLPSADTNYTIPYNTIPYYTILYHTIPYYTILYYTILYYTILYYTIPYHTIPYHTIPYHTIPYHTIQYHTIPYHTIPCYAMLCYTILYYTILYYTILYDTILYYNMIDLVRCLTAGTPGKGHQTY